jgi:hypothetical protein
MEIVNDRGIEFSSSSRSCTRRLSRSPNRSVSRTNQPPYTILTGPDDPRQLVDCRIILVNPRQRFSLNNKKLIFFKIKMCSEVMVKKSLLVLVVMV